MEDHVIIETTESHNAKPMNGTGQGLGVVGLVFGVIGLMFAFVPCVGMLALIPAAIGLICSIIGLVIAYNSIYRGLILAAFIVSFLGAGVAATQALILTGVVHTAQKYADHTEPSISTLTEDAGLSAEEILEKYGYRIDGQGNLSDESFRELRDELEALYKKSEQTVSRLEDGKVLATKDLPGLMTEGALLFNRCDMLQHHFSSTQRLELADLEMQFEELKNRMIAFGF